MNLLFLGSYWLLLIVTYSLLNEPALQRVVTIGWLFAVTLGHVQYQRKRKVPLHLTLYTVLFAQLPGFVGAVASLSYVRTGHANEWANGLLELWYYPFISILEVLPKHTISQLSDVYVATCALPVLIVTFNLSSWYIAKATERRASMYGT